MKILVNAVKKKKKKKTPNQTAPQGANFNKSNDMNQQYFIREALEFAKANPTTQIYYDKPTLCCVAKDVDFRHSPELYFIYPDNIRLIDLIRAHDQKKSEIQTLENKLSSEYKPKYVQMFGRVDLKPDVVAAIACGAFDIFSNSFPTPKHWGRKPFSTEYAYASPWKKFIDDMKVDDKQRIAEMAQKQTQSISADVSSLHTIKHLTDDIKCKFSKLLSSSTNDFVTNKTIQMQEFQFAINAIQIELDKLKAK